MVNRMHRNNRYGEYYLVNDAEMDEIGFDEVPKQKCSRRCKVITASTLILLVVLTFLTVFVILPLVFMNSVYLQRILVFTHFDLPESREYYEDFYLSGYANRYVTVKDLHSGEDKDLGVWQILPIDLAYQSFKNYSFDFDKAFLSSNYSVLIYFHGTGEARSYSARKYQMLRHYFHIVAFDYRSYADSSKGVLSEEAVVHDCSQLFDWVSNRTKSDIYIWGHSLGSALATETMAKLQKLGVSSKGLVLEAPFTSLEDELYVHPYGKIFSWLPWFEETIINPLKKNGFVFDTAANILNISAPIMILHAEDDSVVPYKLGKKLFEIASTKRNESIKKKTIFIHFNETLGYDHFYIYQDPFIEFFVRDFIYLSNKPNVSYLTST